MENLVPEVAERTGSARDRTDPDDLAALRDQRQLLEYAQSRSLDLSNDIADGPQPLACPDVSVAK